MSDNTYSFTTYANRKSRTGSTPPNGRATPPPGALVNGSSGKRHPAAASVHVHEGRSKKTSNSRVFNTGSDGQSIITIVVTGPECDDGATKAAKPCVGVTFAANDVVGETEMTQLVSTSTSKVL